MLSLKNVYYFQAGIGILANAFLLLFHIYTINQNHRTKPSDVTTCHLAFVHIVMLLTTLDILSADIFKSLNAPNDLTCKALFYLSRVMRGLSICTTCLLSIIQVITISPSTFYLSRFKNQLTKYIIRAFFCVWSLNLSSNSNMIIYTVAHSNITNLLNINKYCSLPSMKPIIMSIFFTLAVSQNVFFVAGMLISSVYMVIFLSSHQKRSRYLHSMKVLPRTSPTTRATQTVLLLVSFFVIMYCLDIIISSSSAILEKYDPVVLDVQRLVCNVYATVSPLVFISSDKRIAAILQNMIYMTPILKSR
ncbi:putative vomeronasal receptor-like protein 4 [Lepus europaeus]|uniref:putative vomeronasal receptor-like protein 4 n=1 Tax=Lepus europaeus TaxID=9983 RepID=UPI002B4671C7|nr:putative vomeronasal receptor-like protein 4 [Lepus europaeus]